MRSILGHLLLFFALALVGGAGAAAAAEDGAKPAPPAVESAGCPDELRTARRVRLDTGSARTATLGQLTLTLEEVLEVAEEHEGHVSFKRVARIEVRRGTDRKSVDLSAPVDVFEHRLTLYMAGDGQATPTSPRESFAEFDVTCASPRPEPTP